MPKEKTPEKAPERAYLKKLRRDYDLSQKELCSMLGDDLSQSGYVKIEDGRKIYLSNLLPYLIKLAEIYCVSVYDLVILETDYNLAKLGMVPDHENDRNRADNSEIHEFGAALKNALKLTKTSQSELAARIGSTKQYISFLIYSYKLPSADKAKEICAALKLPEDYFDKVLKTAKNNQKERSK